MPAAGAQKSRQTDRATGPPAFVSRPQATNQSETRVGRDSRSALDTGIGDGRTSVTGT